jgi:hypothetical protein
MGGRARPEAGHVFWMLHEHEGDPGQDVEARAESGPTRPEARVDDRDAPPPECDPYQDEGGEG